MLLHYNLQCSQPLPIQHLQMNKTTSWGNSQFSCVLCTAISIKFYWCKFTISETVTTEDSKWAVGTLYHYIVSFLRYSIVQNFDRYWLFKYSMENILTDRYCLSPCTCKCCTVFKQFWQVKFWWSSSKTSKFPPLKILHYTVLKFHESLIYNFIFNNDFLQSSHELILTKQYRGNLLSHNYWYDSSR